LREALARLFRKRTDLRVVGQCPYSDTIAAQVTESLCDVLLLDQATLSSSASVIPQIIANSPHVRIILFGMEEDVGKFLTAVQFGVVAYLLKDASTGDIIATIRNVARGEAVCPPRLCLALFQYVARESHVTAEMLNQRLNRKLGLTRRQQQLVSLVAMGLTNKEIASRLNLSEYTVKNHIHRLLRQVDAGSRYEAIENIRASGFTVISSAASAA
jgi:RNA polymerase sigma factor (sigma-70 family)